MTLRWLFPVLLCLLMIGPASAQTLSAPGVSSYSFQASPGFVIYQVTVGDLPIGTNQTHTLRYNGDTYLLTVGTYQESIGGLWKNAEISLTYPNGTTITDHASTPDFVGQYKTHIQYVFPQSYSAVNPFVSINLIVGISDATVSFNNAPSMNPEAAVAFTAVSGELGGTTDVWIEEITIEDFQDNIVNYNPLYGIGNLGSQVFQWTWSAILGFVNMIPVIGPIAAGVLEAMGNVMTEGVFWFLFLLQNFPAILAGLEVLIMMMATINAGTGKKALPRLGHNLVAYNAMFLYGVVWVVEIMFNWSVKALETIASVVNALKPI